MAGLKLVLVLLVCAAVAAPLTVDAQACNYVYNTFRPCFSYIRGGGTPTTACCNGLRAILAAAETTADRQTTCRCLTYISGASTSDPVCVFQLPDKCGVTMTYPITPFTNCALVNSI